jgi:hypothetical protein
MMQRALVQYRNPANRELIREALRELGVEHLGAKFFRKRTFEKIKRGRD